MSRIIWKQSFGNIAQHNTMNDSAKCFSINKNLDHKIDVKMFYKNFMLLILRKEENEGGVRMVFSLVFSSA